LEGNIGNSHQKEQANASHASSNAQAATYQDVIFEISKLLNTGLSKETVEICTKMIEEQGVNPLALASFIKQVTTSAEGKRNLDQ
jgi:predicted component of type VI protein secretion system